MDEKVVNPRSANFYKLSSKEDYDNLIKQLSFDFGPDTKVEAFDGEGWYSVELFKEDYVALITKISPNYFEQFKKIRG